MLDILLFILDLLFPIGRKKGISKEATNFTKPEPKNVVNIMLGGISGFIVVEAFYIVVMMSWGNLGIGGFILFGVFGGLGGITGLAIANRIHESKLSAIIGGTLGGALVCGLLILLFMVSNAQ